MHLHDAAAKRGAVEINSEHQLFLGVEVDVPHVGFADIWVDSTEQGFDGCLEILAPEGGVHRGAGLLQERFVNPTAVSAAKTPPFPTWGVSSSPPQLRGKVSATSGSYAEHNPTFCGDQHRQQRTLPHLLQIGDIGELIAEDQIRCLSPQSIGVIGAS